LDSRTIPLTTALSVFLGMGHRVLLLHHVSFRAELLPNIWAARRRVRTAIENTQIFTKIGRLRQAATDPVHPSNTNWDSSSYICYHQIITFTYQQRCYQQFQQQWCSARMLIDYTSNFCSLCGMSANSDGSPLRLLLRQDFHRYVQSLRRKLLISQKAYETARQILSIRMRIH
jgi:hypothetical protein